MSHRTHHEVVAQNQTDFSITDEKGRAVGCVTYLAMETYAEGPGEWGNYARDPGDWFTAKFHATRNGESYGASNGTEYFRSRGEAEAFLAKQVDKCRKRYAKKYGTK